MHVLEITDQTQNGAELKKIIPLEGAYDVLMKTPIQDGENSKNRFNKAIYDFYEKPEDKAPVAIDSTITGFVYCGDKTYPIRDFEVAYIVNSEGKTFKRIYGIHQKY